MSFVGLLRKIGKAIVDSDYRFLVLASHGFLGGMRAEAFLQRAYRCHMGKDLDLAHPVTYTEKLQWLKLYDHRPEYTCMVDKYAVKRFVAEKIGEEHVIPVLGVWSRVEDIDFSILPDRFVLKTTHDSGGIFVCDDKGGLDERAVRKRMRYFLRRNYYARNREWPYKNVPHRIIAEEYIEDARYGELRDYKFFTFGGVPKVLYIAKGRGRGVPVTADFFDMDFNHLPFAIDHEIAEAPPEKPDNFEKMREFAAVLSQGTPQLRVDFYEANGKLYFGEMTFFHCSGLYPFHPESWDKIFGDWVELPSKRIG